MLAMKEINSISRRSFLHVGTAGAIGLAGARYLSANPLGLPIGCQTWPVRESIGKDLDGTLKELAGMGFERIELCSPPGYATMGFGPLAQMKPSELRDKIHAAGLGCESCHYGFTELKDHLDERTPSTMPTSSANGPGKRVSNLASTTTISNFRRSMANSSTTSLWASSTRN